MEDKLKVIVVHWAAHPYAGAGIVRGPRGDRIATAANVRPDNVSKHYLFYK